MNILITGSNGAIAKYLIKELTNTSTYTVIGLDISSENKNNTNRYVQMDISCSDGINELITKVGPVDIIIHLAALIDMSEINDEIIHVNIIGTNHLIQFGIQVKIKQFIYLSSVPVIGKPHIIPITEEHPLNPNSYYHISKLAGEYMVRRLMSLNIKYSVLRIPAPLSPSMRQNTFIPTILKKALHDETIEILGMGGRKQNYLDVRDIVKCIYLVLFKQIQGTFNIGAKKTYSNIEMIEKCMRLTNSKSIIKYLDRLDPSENEDWDIDCQKAYDYIGFEQKYEIDETLIWLVESYRIIDSDN